jgi:hypothetical protein
MTSTARLPSPATRALALLERAFRISPYFLIMASGGKDSNVLFPLVQKLQAKHPSVRVAACHWYLPVPGLDCVERPIHALRRRFADCPIFYVPHYTLPDHLWYPGGKRKLFAEINKRLPQGSFKYAEPFWGGGSIGVRLAGEGRLVQLVAGEACGPVRAFWEQLVGEGATFDAEMRQRGLVVGVIRHFRHVFHVGHDVVGIDDKNGPGKKAKFFDQRSVSLAEGSVTVIGNCLKVFDVRGLTETPLSEGKVHADDIGLNTGYSRNSLVKLFGFLFAHRGVQGRNRNKEPGFPL